MSHKDKELNEKTNNKDSDTLEIQNMKLGMENKSSLMTTVTTSNKIEDKQLSPMKYGVFYSQIFSAHTKTNSIASVNKFDQNFPGFERDIENVSCIISDDPKDHDVNVNISSLDLENSMIKGIERLETMFQLTNSNRNLITDTEKEGQDKEANAQTRQDQLSVVSIESPNTKQNQHKNEKKKLITQSKQSGSPVFKRRFLIAISSIVLIAILSILFFIVY